MPSLSENQDRDIGSICDKRTTLGLKQFVVERTNVRPVPLIVEIHVGSFDVAGNGLNEGRRVDDRKNEGLYVAVVDAAIAIHVVQVV